MFQTEKTLSAFQWTLFLLFFLRQSWTRHQFYLQFWKDILEEKLYYNDEILLQLGVLALQAVFGSYPEEVEEESWGSCWGQHRSSYGTKGNC